MSSEIYDLDDNLKTSSLINTVRDFFYDLTDIWGAGDEEDIFDMPAEDITDLCVSRRIEQPLETIDEELKASLDKVIGEHDVIQVESDPKNSITTVLFSEVVKDVGTINKDLKIEFGVYSVFDGATGSTKSCSHTEKPEVYNAVEVTSRGLDRTAAKNVFTSLTAR